MKTLEELLAVAQAATPGPYFVAVNEDTARTLVGPIKTNSYGEYKKGTIVAQCFGPTLGQAEADAEYIAAFNPAVVQALVRECLASRALDEHRFDIARRFGPEFESKIELDLAIKIGEARQATDEALKT